MGACPDGVPTTIEAEAPDRAQSVAPIPTVTEPVERRGQPSRASECWFDARMAIRELEVARDLYALANDTTDPRSRAERMKAAHDRSALASRFVAFLLRRPPR